MAATVPSRQREFIVRNLVVLSGVLALALLAEPAKADPTSNTVFVVIDLGYTSEDKHEHDDGGGHEFSNGEGHEHTGTQNLLFINLASVGGTFPFIDLTFAGLGEINLEDYVYFIIGEKDGSEHLLLSGDDEGAGYDFDPVFEQRIIDGVTNLDGVGGLATPGGTAIMDPAQFEGLLGAPIGTFMGPGALFDMTASTGEGMDLIGFTQGQILGSITFNPDGSTTFDAVPEPGLAFLAVVGLAGTVIARRRRRAA